MRNPGLADIGVVPESIAAVCNTTDKTGTGKESFEAARAANSAAPALQVPNLASLPLIREQLNNIGLSSDAANILLASWRKTTGKQYRTYVSRWLLYCQKQRLNMNQATVNDGLEFLTYHYGQGLGYSATNTVRSALSALITLGDKTTVL